MKVTGPLDNTLKPNPLISVGVSTSIRAVQAQKTITLINTLNTQQCIQEVL